MGQASMRLSEDFNGSDSLSLISRHIFQCIVPREVTGWAGKRDWMTSVADQPRRSGPECCLKGPVIKAGVRNSVLLIAGNPA
jgi:hypothetical protein